MSIEKPERFLKAQAEGRAVRFPSANIVITLTKGGFFVILSSPLNFFSRTNKETCLVKNSDELKREVERIVRSKNAFAIVFKRNVSSVVVAGLDAISEMEINDRIDIPYNSDIEKMRYARFNLAWYSSKAHDRTVVFRPGRLFSVGWFLTRVAPAINELREYTAFN
jgi:hypothetical protein